MPDKILFVDDDPNILSGFQRFLRGRFEIDTAPGAVEALDKLRSDSEFSVIVSDYRMPGIDGVQFLTQAAVEWPDTVRVLLTGEADTKAAGAAVNQGQIFRFLLKPCPPALLEKTLTAAISHHKLICAEKVLLEKTLRGSMEVVIDLLNLVAPHAFNQSAFIYQTIQTLLADQKIDGKWEFEIAGLLSKVGHVTVPPEILEKRFRREELTSEEKAIYATHPSAASRLLAKIPRLETVAAIIGTQGHPLPSIPSWQPIEEMDRLALGAHLLDIAIRWEAFQHLNHPATVFVAEMCTLTFPAAIVKLAQSLKSAVPSTSETKLVHSSQLESGMILDSDLVSSTGMLLLAKGQTLSPFIIESLHRRHEYYDVDELVAVRANLNS